MTDDELKRCLHDYECESLPQMLREVAAQSKHCRSEAGGRIPTWPLIEAAERLAALSALPRAEADDGWRTIESAPKTDPVNMRALPFLGWCPDKTAPLGGDIRVIWWEPVMQRADETSPRARWYGDRDMEEQPTHWRPLPNKPEVNSND